MKKIKSACFIMFFLAACSSQPEVEIPEEIAALENITVFPADTEPEFEIALTREASFGDTEDIFLGGWLTAAVDNRERVFLADQQETVIHLYNPDGTYNRQIGREGEGPGEYRSIGQMRTDNQYFYLMDRNLNRITLYDLDTFEVITDHAVPVNQDEDDGNFRYPNAFHLMPDDQYLIHFGMAFMSGSNGSDDDSRKLEGRILNPENESYEPGNVFSFPASEALVHREGNSMMVMSVPYKRSSHVTYRNNKIYHGWSEHFLLKVYDDEGNYQRSIYYTFPNRRLNRDKVLELHADRDQQWRDMVRNDNMPETWPVYYSFLVDDENRFWVEMVTEDTEASEYVVLQETGELLGRIPWSRDKTIQQVKNGFLYTQEEDEMGLREIVKYRVEFI
ncbi:MAG: 6-bladed beta-propeller [Balneolaceae bacterium]